MNLQVVFSGDILVGGEVGERIGRSTIKEWVADVSNVWSGADLLIGNLECPCVIKAKPLGGQAPELIFSAPVTRLAELADAGFSAVTIANNHILNCGTLGLKETLQGLDSAGIHHAGAGMNLAEAMQPAFVRIKGLTIGLVAFCYGPAASWSTAGVAPYDFKVMGRSLNLARAGADFVVAALHDGLEYSDVPPSETRARFRFLAENGADIVVGHHPHVLQGLEWIGNVPVAYSLGNFLFHSSLPHVTQRSFRRIAMGLYAPQEIQRDPEKFSRGALLSVDISGTTKSAQWHPFTQTSDLRPQLCAGQDKTERIRHLADLSAALHNEQDFRHALANSILHTVQWKNRQGLTTRELIKMALNPKWRYLPQGMKWLLQRMRVSKEPSLPDGFSSD